MFKNAIKEIDELVKKENESKREQNTEKITLKDMTIAELLATFDENQIELQDLFDRRRGILDRLNYGNGYDFLTVLSRTLTSEQQQQMFGRIGTVFTGDFKKYIQNPKVNLIL